MIIQVDPLSAVPPYEQIREQIVLLIGSGALTEGARLPAIRQLANDLAVAAGTVARAYKELEADGVVSSRVRHGTVVTARGVPSTSQGDYRLLAAARAYALAARGLGIGRDEAVRAFDVQLGELPGNA